MASTKILIVDDDIELVKMLKEFLMIKGYDINFSYGGSHAIELIKDNPDLILLDVNMPDIDGLSVCRQIRDKISCPIIFLTAKSEEQDQINGLMSGADDYIVKPFSLKELDARIKAHLRREERHKIESKYRFSNGLMINYSSRTVDINGTEVILTKTEYDIIEFLSMHPGQVFDKERLYEAVSGYDSEGDSRVVTELIRRIRNKLQETSETQYIETVWGIGYKWIK